MVITKIVLEKANRLYQMPLGLLSYVRTEKRRGLLKRADLLDLASFAWPVAPGETASSDIYALAPAPKEMLDELGEEIANWLRAVHGATIVPRKELFIGGSITHLIGQLMLSLVDHGDLAFVPELGAPLYRQAITCAGGEAVTYGVSAKTDWLPDFERLGSRVGRVARLVVVNSPHNPTGAVLSERAMTSLAWTASKENLLVINDAAYMGIPEPTAVSLLSVAGGKRIGVEVYSFSYQFGLPRLPFGFVAGNREVISALNQIAHLFPTPVPHAFVKTALTAIRQYPSTALKAARTHCARTADRSADLMELLGLEECGMRTVPYLWTKIPKRRHAETFARQVYRRHRILTVPGTDFGDAGQGYLRFSLTAGQEAYSEAAERVKKRRARLKRTEKNDD